MLSLIGHYAIAVLESTSEAARLAEIYLKTEIIPSSYRLDSLHVAAASVYKLDCVVSYNFRHINRDKTRILTTNVNNTEGYGGVVICTAKEVLCHEQPDI